MSREQLKAESESSRFPVRLRIRYINGLWARCSMLSHLFSFYLVTQVHQLLPSNPRGQPVGCDEGYRDDGSRVMTRFSEDEETEFEYRLHIELIDEIPSSISTAHEGRPGVSLSMPWSALAPHSLVDGGPPSAILAAPAVKSPLEVATTFREKPGGRRSGCVSLRRAREGLDRKVHGRQEASIGGSRLRRSVWRW